MKRVRVQTLPANPFLVWAQLAFRAGEMMMASAQVIGHRTDRMTTGGSWANARDRREFSRMGREKFEAATESAQAMAAHMMTMDPRPGLRASQQMFEGTTAMTSLIASRTVGQYLERQARLMRVMSNSGTAASWFSDSTARLAQHGLKPIHSRATANARRLGKSH